MQVQDLFSLSEAAEYVGRVERTFKKQVYELGWVIPIRLGEGETADMLIFTRRMLEEYKKLHAARLLGQVLIHPSDEEKTWIEQNVKTFPQAAEYLGENENALYTAVMKKQIHGGKKLRGRWLFFVKDLDAYRETKRPRGRPKTEG